jgi:lactoylglutathione lyase
MEIEIILYVENQSRSKDFYAKLLRKEPILDVQGMAEFMLGDHCKLGLMPSSGIAGIICDKMPHPQEGQGIPRCELYLRVQDAVEEYEHAVKIGATVISPVALRDWGDMVGYLADRDGHIIAFASAAHDEI